MWQEQMLEWDLSISEASLEALLFHPLNLGNWRGAECIMHRQLLKRPLPRRNKAIGIHNHDRDVSWRHIDDCDIISLGYFVGDSVAIFKRWRFRGGGSPTVITLVYLRHRATVIEGREYGLTPSG
jgi:hypothetical protein